jgi:hypothetical protein
MRQGERACRATSRLWELTESPWRLGGNDVPSWWRRSGGRRCLWHGPVAREEGVGGEVRSNRRRRSGADGAHLRPRNAMTFQPNSGEAPRRRW